MPIIKYCKDCDRLHLRTPKDFIYDETGVMFKCLCGSFVFVKDEDRRVF